MQYYIIINGVQSGPFSKDELLLQGVKSDTFIWYEGLPEWVRANTLPELADLFYAPEPTNSYKINFEKESDRIAEAERQSQPIAPPPPVNPQTYPPYNPYGQPGYPTGYQIPHTNWLPWAIIVTVLSAFSCIGLIIGIISIINASKANDFYANGRVAEGDSANNTARILTIVNIVLLGITIIAYVIYFFAILASYY